MTSVGIGYMELPLIKKFSVSTVLMGTFTLFATAAFPKDVKSPFIKELGHRATVYVEGAPDGFLESLFEADVDGLLDDIARPTGVFLADLSIFLLDDPQDFRNFAAYEDIGYLESDMTADWVQPVRVLTGYTRDPNGDTRPIIFYFFNRSVSDHTFTKNEASICFARYVYTTALFDNIKEVLESYPDCQ